MLDLLSSVNEQPADLIMLVEWIDLRKHYSNLDFQWFSPSAKKQRSAVQRCVAGYIFYLYIRFEVIVLGRFFEN